MRTVARRLRVAGLVGHLAFAGVAVAVPVTVTGPLRRTGTFWGLMAWTVVLALLRWSLVAGYPARYSPGWRPAGGPPDLGSLATACWSLSVALTWGAAFLLPKGVTSGLHLAVQLGMGPLFLLTGLRRMDKAGALPSGGLFSPHLHR